MQKQEPKIIAPGYSDEELFAWMSEKTNVARELSRLISAKEDYLNCADKVEVKISELSTLAAIEVLQQEELTHGEFSAPTEEMITIDKALFKQLLKLALDNPNFASQIADVDVNCSAAPASEIFMHLKPSDFLLRLEATLRAFG